MTIRHLKVFICVCKHKNMTKAAEELFIAQPAVSKTIADIEEKYHVVLFQRVNKQLLLTEEGNALLIKAKEVVAAFDAFENEANNASSAPTVKIGSSITIGKQQLPNLLKMLKDEFEGLHFQVSINQTALIESKILDGTLDFAFIQGLPSNLNISANLIDRNTLVAVCGPSYPIPSALTLKELCRYDLLLREDDSVSREFLDHAFATKDIVIKPIIESVSNQALISSAMNNLGVTLLPESLVDAPLKSGKLKKITITDHTFIRSSYLIYHKNKTFSATIKKIYEFARSNFQNA